MCGLGRTPSLSVTVLLLQGSPSLILRICLAVFCSGDPVSPRHTHLFIFSKKKPVWLPPAWTQAPRPCCVCVRARFLILTLPAPSQKGRVLACVL